MYILIFLSLNFINAQVLKFPTCCFCFADQDPDTQRECKTFLSTKECKNARTEIITLNPDAKESISKIAKKSIKPTTCKKSILYAAQHGASSDYRLPFDLSKVIATKYQSSQICYDGSSCSVFNNYERLNACAEQLHRDLPNCKFDISANQNLGATDDFDDPYYREINCPTRGVLENPDAESKIQVLIESKLFSKEVVKLVYPKCKNTNQGCQIIDYRSDSDDNNPNSQICFHKKNLIEQICCPQKNREDGHPGYWQTPGSACKRS